MSILNSEPPEPTRLTLMDQAVIMYHGFGEDFVSLLDAYISTFPEAKRYVHIGPDYYLLFHEEVRTDPTAPDTLFVEPYWYITYAAATSGHPLRKFMEHMPYHLDRVGFNRYGKYPGRGVRTLETERLRKYFKSDN